MYLQHTCLHTTNAHQNQISRTLCIYIHIHTDAWYWNNDQSIPTTPSNMKKRSHPGGPTEGGNSVSSSRVGSSVIFRNRLLYLHDICSERPAGLRMCVCVGIYYTCIWLYMVIKLVWSKSVIRAWWRSNDVITPHSQIQMVHEKHKLHDLFRSRLRATDPIQIVGMSLMAWVPDTACQANPTLAIVVVALYVRRVWILFFLIRHV